MRLVLAIALLYQIDSFLVLATHEGSGCVLKNGDKGVCTPISRCPSKLREMQEGKIQRESFERCGIDRFTETVCCAQELSSRMELRPAAIACQEYREKYYKDSERQKKTFNENEAHGVEFPYAVALVYNGTVLPGMPRFYYLCAGILISDEHVLTTATCIDPFGYNIPIEVHLGDREPNSTDWVRISVGEITVHPQHNGSYAFYNDLAIIKLEKKVQMAHNIKPICLQTQPLSDVDLSLAKFLIAIEWLGASIYPEYSRRVTGQYFGIVDKEKCNKHYNNPPNGLYYGVVDSQVCALSKSLVGAGVCKHRNGSPLVMLTDSESTLVGVTSFGFDCGYYYPVICTGIYDHLDWIEEKVWPSLNRISLVKSVSDEDVLDLHK